MENSDDDEIEISFQEWLSASAFNSALVGMLSACLTFAVLVSLLFYTSYFSRVIKWELKNQSLDKSSKQVARQQSSLTLLTGEQKGFQTLQAFPGYHSSPEFHPRNSGPFWRPYHFPESDGSHFEASPSSKHGYENCMSASTNFSESTARSCQECYLPVNNKYTGPACRRDELQGLQETQVAEKSSLQDYRQGQQEHDWAQMKFSQMDLPNQKRELKLILPQQDSFKLNITCRNLGSRDSLSLTDEEQPYSTEGGLSHIARVKKKYLSTERKRNRSTSRQSQKKVKGEDRKNHSKIRAQDKMSTQPHWRDVSLGKPKDQWQREDELSLQDKTRFGMHNQHCQHGSSASSSPSCQEMNEDLHREMSAESSDGCVQNSEMELQPQRPSTQHPACPANTRKELRDFKSSLLKLPENIREKIKSALATRQFMNGHGLYETRTRRHGQELNGRKYRHVPGRLGLWNRFLLEPPHYYTQQVSSRASLSSPTLSYKLRPTLDVRKTVTSKKMNDQETAMSSAWSSNNDDSLIAKRARRTSPRIDLSRTCKGRNLDHYSPRQYGTSQRQNLRKRRVQNTVTDDSPGPSSPEQRPRRDTLFTSDYSSGLSWSDSSQAGECVKRQRHRLYRHLQESGGKIPGNRVDLPLQFVRTANKKLRDPTDLLRKLTREQYGDSANALLYNSSGDGSQRENRNVKQSVSLQRIVYRQRSAVCDMRQNCPTFSLQGLSRRDIYQNVNDVGSPREGQLDARARRRNDWKEKHGEVISLHECADELKSLIKSTISDMQMYDSIVFPLVKDNPQRHSFPHAKSTDEVIPIPAPKLGAPGAKSSVSYGRDPHYKAPQDSLKHKHQYQSSGQRRPAGVQTPDCRNKDAASGQETNQSIFSCQLGEAVRADAEYLCKKDSRDPKNVACESQGLRDDHVLDHYPAGRLLARSAFGADMKNGHGDAKSKVLPNSTLVSETGGAYRDRLQHSRKRARNVADATPHNADGHVGFLRDKSNEENASLLFGISKTIAPARLQHRKRLRQQREPGATPGDTTKPTELMSSKKTVKDVRTSKPRPIATQKDDHRKPESLPAAQTNDAFKSKGQLSKQPPTVLASEQPVTMPDQKMPASDALKESVKRAPISPPKSGLTRIHMYYHDNDTKKRIMPLVSSQDLLMALEDEQSLKRKCQTSRKAVTADFCRKKSVPFKQVSSTTNIRPSTECAAKKSKSLIKSPNEDVRSSPPEQDRDGAKLSEDTGRPIKIPGMLLERQLSDLVDDLASILATKPPGILQTLNCTKMNNCESVTQERPLRGQAPKERQSGKKYFPSDRFDDLNHILMATKRQVKQKDRLYGEVNMHLSKSQRLLGKKRRGGNSLQIRRLISETLKKQPPNYKVLKLLKDTIAESSSNNLVSLTSKYEKRHGVKPRQRTELEEGDKKGRNNNLRAVDDDRSSELTLVSTSRYTNLQLHSGLSQTRQSCTTCSYLTQEALTFSDQFRGAYEGRNYKHEPFMCDSVSAVLASVKDVYMNPTKGCHSPVRSQSLEKQFTKNYVKSVQRKPDGLNVTKMKPGHVPPFNISNSSFKPRACQRCGSRAYVACNRIQPQDKHRRSPKNAYTHRLSPYQPVLDQPSCSLVSYQSLKPELPKIRQNTDKTKSALFCCKNLPRGAQGKDRQHSIYGRKVPVVEFSTSCKESLSSYSLPARQSFNTNSFHSGTPEESILSVSDRHLRLVNVCLCKSQSWIEPESDYTYRRLGLHTNTAAHLPNAMHRTVHIQTHNSPPSVLFDGEEVSYMKIVPKSGVFKGLRLSRLNSVQLPEARSTSDKTKYHSGKKSRQRTQMMYYCSSSTPTMSSSACHTVYTLFSVSSLSSSDTPRYRHRHMKYVDYTASSSTSASLSSASFMEWSARSSSKRREAKCLRNRRMHRSKKDQCQVEKLPVGALHEYEESYAGTTSESQHNYDLMHFVDNNEIGIQVPSQMAYRKACDYPRVKFDEFCKCHRGRCLRNGIKSSAERNHENGVFSFEGVRNVIANRKAKKVDAANKIPLQERGAAVKEESAETAENVVPLLANCRQSDKQTSCHMDTVPPKKQLVERESQASSVSLDAHYKMGHHNGFHQTQTQDLDTKAVLSNQKLAKPRPEQAYPRSRATQCHDLRTNYSSQISTEDNSAECAAPGRKVRENCCAQRKLYYWRKRDSNTKIISERRSLDITASGNDTTVVCKRSAAKRKSNAVWEHRIKVQPVKQECEKEKKNETLTRHELATRRKYQDQITAHENNTSTEFQSHQEHEPDLGFSARRDVTFTVEGETPSCVGSKTDNSPLPDTPNERSEAHFLESSPKTLQTKRFSNEYQKLKAKIQGKSASKTQEQNGKALAANTSLPRKMTQKVTKKTLKSKCSLKSTRKAFHNYQSLLQSPLRKIHNKNELEESGKINHEAARDGEVLGQVRCLAEQWESRMASNAYSDQTRGHGSSALATCHTDVASCIETEDFTDTNILRQTDRADLPAHLNAKASKPFQFQKGSVKTVMDDSGTNEMWIKFDFHDLIKALQGMEHKTRETNHKNTEALAKSSESRNAGFPDENKTKPNLGTHSAGIQTERNVGSNQAEKKTCNKAVSPLVADSTYDETKTHNIAVSPTVMARNILNRNLSQQARPSPGKHVTEKTQYQLSVSSNSNKALDLLDATPLMSTYNFPRSKFIRLARAKSKLKKAQMQASTKQAPSRHQDVVKTGTNAAQSSQHQSSDRPVQYGYLKCVEREADTIQSIKTFDGNFHSEIPASDVESNVSKDSEALTLSQMDQTSALTETFHVTSSQMQLTSKSRRQRTDNNGRSGLKAQTCTANKNGVVKPQRATHRMKSQIPVYRKPGRTAVSKSKRKPSLLPVPKMEAAGSSLKRKARQTSEDVSEQEPKDKGAHISGKSDCTNGSAVTFSPLMTCTGECVIIGMPPFQLNADGRANISINDRGMPDRQNKVVINVSASTLPRLQDPALYSHKLQGYVGSRGLQPKQQLDKQTLIRINPSPSPSVGEGSNHVRDWELSPRRWLHGSTETHQSQPDVKGKEPLEKTAFRAEAKGHQNRFLETIVESVPVEKGPRFPYQIQRGDHWTETPNQETKRKMQTLKSQARKESHRILHSTQKTFERTKPLDKRKNVTFSSASTIFPTSPNMKLKTTQVAEAAALKKRSLDRCALKSNVQLFPSSWHKTEDDHQKIAPAPSSKLKSGSKGISKAASKRCNLDSFPIIPAILQAAPQKLKELQKRRRPSGPPLLRTSMRSQARMLKRGSQIITTPQASWKTDSDNQNILLHHNYFQQHLKKPTLGGKMEDFKSSRNAGTCNFSPDWADPGHALTQESLISNGYPLSRLPAKEVAVRSTADVYRQVDERRKSPSRQVKQQPKRSGYLLDMDHNNKTMPQHLQLSGIMNDRFCYSPIPVLDRDGDQQMNAKDYIITATTSDDSSQISSLYLDTSDDVSASMVFGKKSSPGEIHI